MKKSIAPFLVALALMSGGATSRAQAPNPPTAPAPAVAPPAPPTPAVKIVTATYFGGAEDDDLQGVTAAPDGTLYVVGNTGAGAKNLPV